MERTAIITSPLADVFKDYIAFLDCSERTAKTYTGNIRQFIKWAQEKGIQRPTRQDIIAYRDELRERCKPSTVQGYITALRLFFQWTQARGIYPDISQHIKSARRDNSFKRDYLNAGQLQDILSNIDTQTAKGKRDYSVITLMAVGGLRCIEVSRADIEDLRQLGGHTRLYLQGKGRDGKAEYIKVPPAVEKPLREYLRTRQAAKGKQPLFASLSNNSKGQRLSPKSISALVKNRFIAAGYNSDRLTAHSLRHSAISIALMSGLPLEEVSTFARHKNISTTEIYNHIIDRERNRSETAIANAIFPKQKGGNA